MFKLKCLFGTAAVLVAALGLGRAADDTTYDLRGPAPMKGQVLVVKGTAKIKDADTTMKAAGETIALKLTLDATSEEETKILAVDGRNVTKAQTKVVKERSDATATVAGMDVNQSEPGSLEKETIISERDGKKWKHALADGKPTEKQKKELDGRDGPENGDDLYPKDKVKAGHTWKADAAALPKGLALFHNSFSDVKGSVEAKFVKVEEVDGESCAVIEWTGKITAKMKDEGEPNADVEITDLKITTHKSLKTGVNVKEKFTGKLKLTGNQKMGDVKVDITMTGPFSGEATTKLK